MTYKFDEEGGRFSILADNVKTLCWIMEREWNNNRRNVSCVPRGVYVLEPHNGNKYKDTYAFTNDYVGHYESEGKPRYACVIHKSVFPSGLSGCFAPAKEISHAGHTVRCEEATAELLDYIDKHTTLHKRVRVVMQ